LGIFVGGWTLEAAEVVCTGDGDLELDMLDGLQSLVDKSLLRQVEGLEGEARFMMLVTIREYAVELLKVRGELGDLRARHAEHFLRLAEAAAPELVRAEQAARYLQLEAEHDNLRAALAWTLERGRVDLAARFVDVLWRFWHVRAYRSEGRKWIGALLAQEKALPVPARAKVLGAAGRLAAMQSDYEAARPLLEESLALAQAVGDKQTSAWALNDLGNLALVRDDYAAARASYEASLVLGRAMGDVLTLGPVLGNLGWVAFMQGDYQAARAYYEESLAVTTEVGDKHGIAIMLANLGALALQQGDYRAARERFQEGLATASAIGATATVVETLEGFAGIASRSGKAVRAMRLVGAATALREVIGVPRMPFEQGMVEGWLAPARRQLSTEEGAAARAEGRAMPLEQAIAYALEGTGQTAERR
jgi:non-specific serine/threonine protein kinase